MNSLGAAQVWAGDGCWGLSCPGVLCRDRAEPRKKGRGLGKPAGLEGAALAGKMLPSGSEGLGPGAEDAAMELLPRPVGVSDVSSPSNRRGFPPAQLSLPPSHRARPAVIKSHLTAAEKAEFPAGNDFFELFAIKTKLT